MSKSTKKKQPSAAQVPKTDKQYLAAGMARRLPVAQCWLNPNWREGGLATLIVARQHKNGNYTLGTYLIDVFCLGLKQTSYRVNETAQQYDFVVNYLFTEQKKVPVDYVLAHNIIYGGIAYANELGFKPDKDWALSQYVLQPDDEETDLLELEFGKDGKPFYISGPHDKPMEIIAKLEKTIGTGNFHYILQADDDNEFDLDNFLDDDNDESALNAI